MSRHDRQLVLEAMTRLQAFAGSNAPANCPTRVVATGTLEELIEYPLSADGQWRELLLTRSGVSEASLNGLLTRLAELRSAGVRVSCAFDVESASPGAVEQITAEKHPEHHLTCVPLQMCLVDRRAVHVVGEGQEDAWPLLSLSAQPAVTAALDYWHTALDVTPEVERPAAPELSERQLTILRLLSVGLIDDAIAHRLELSVRTVRADLRAAMDSLGAVSRFEAGCAYARLLVAAASPAT